VTGYIVDDAALVAGLGAGTESQRRELSRFVDGALDGGPHLHITALGLAAAVIVRPAIADHVAMLVTSGPAGPFEIRGLRGGQLARIVSEHPGLGFAAAHAAIEAISDGSIIITTDVARYADVEVDAMAL